MVSKERTQEPLHDTAAAAGLFAKLPAASQDAVIEQIKAFLSEPSADPVPLQERGGVKAQDFLDP